MVCNNYVAILEGNGFCLAIQVKEQVRCILLLLHKILACILIFDLLDGLEGGGMT